MEPLLHIDQEKLMQNAQVTAGTADELRALCPEALAAWQVQWKESAAKFVLAEKEWERRNTKEMTYWQRMSAWIGVAGAIVGALIAVLGAVLAKALGLM